MNNIPKMYKLKNEGFDNNKLIIYFIVNNAVKYYNYY